jgi:hypothetical protein
MSLKLPAFVALIIGITTVHGNGVLDSCITEAGTRSLTCNASACNLNCLASGSGRGGGGGIAGGKSAGPAIDGGGDGDAKGGDGDAKMPSSDGDVQIPNADPPNTPNDPKTDGGLPSTGSTAPSQGSDQVCKILCASTIKRALDSTTTLIIGIIVGALVRCPTSL